MSPVDSLAGLAAELGMQEGHLMVLREDLIGRDGGGNKVRKAAAAVGQAVADGMTTVITTGAPQSNHARATALAALRGGIHCVLVLEGAPPTRLLGNNLLEDLAGAEILWSEGAEPAEIAAACAARAPERSRIIPFGGSDPAAVDVYSKVGDELRKTVPDLDHVVVAVGSGATAAGLIRALGPRTVLAVDTGAVPDPEAVLLDLLDRSRPAEGWDKADLRLDRRQVGSGYEHVQPAVLDAVQRVLRTDGVLFDVTYAGRALAATVAAIESGHIRSTDRVLLIHTGGTPGLFGHPELVDPHERH